jgi:methylamine dehydrogenase accessory protein MauD
MTIWLLLNSIGLALVCAILYLVLRQLGYVLNRVAPPGARSTSSGPRIGENVSYYLARLTGSELPPRQTTLIVFGADACSICAQIRQGAQELAKRWRSDANIVLVYDCTNELSQAPLQKLERGLYFKRDCQVREQLGADFVPFGIAVDRDGVVLGKGLVNEIGHLESLLELQTTRGQESANEIAGSGAEA